MRKQAAKCALVLGLAGFLAFASGGCERHGPEKTAEVAVPVWEEDVVAKVGRIDITRAMLRQAQERQGPGAKAEIVLEDLLTFYAMREQARILGTDQDPALRHAFDQMVVNRFQEQAMTRRLAGLPPISEEEARAAYEANHSEYTIPARMRGGLILLRVSSKATESKRGEVARRAQAVREQAHGLSDADFRLLAQRFSEDQATRYRGGDTGWIAEKQAAGTGDPGMRALAELKTPGEVAPLVETEEGYLVVRLSERTPAGRKPYEEVREGLMYRLEAARRQSEQEALRREVLAAHPPRRSGQPSGGAKVASAPLRAQQLPSLPER